MRYSNLLSAAVAAAFAVALGAGPAAAGNTKVKPVKPKAPAASAKPKPVKGPNTSAAAKAKAPKAKPAAATKSQTSLSAAGTRSNKSTKTASKPTMSSEKGTEPGPALSLSKAQEKLLKNENLRAKMAARLGRDPLVAASGFKNLGQFVAAVNVSNNLGIDFNILKRLMVGRGLSLGQAIQQAKAMDAAGATRLANQAVIQADVDIN